MLSKLDHKTEHTFDKRRVFMCKRRPGNQRPGATNFGCIKCQEPFHMHCQAEHLLYHNNIHEVDVDNKTADSIGNDHFADGSDQVE